MSRFQGDDLLALGVGELLNFVNRGECDGAIVSLFWPFDDARCEPLHADLSLSLPNVRLEGRGWPASWPEKRRSVHRSLRDALDEQFVRVVEGEKPILPTRPGWKRRDFAHLSHEKGVPGKVIAQLMGHAKVDTTLNVYTQVMDGGLRDAADTVGAELFTIVH